MEDRIELEYEEASLLTFRWGFVHSTVANVCPALLLGASTAAIEQSILNLSMNTPNKQTGPNLE